MSRLFVILRLAGRDLRHRPGGAVMLIVIIATATAALALGLLLQDTTAHPYQTTREATSGPDALATDFPSGTGAPASPVALRQIAPLARAQDVDGYSGPCPSPSRSSLSMATPTPSWRRDAATRLPPSTSPS